MEDIIKSVTEAEKKAAEIKENAELKGAEILTAAEKRAEEIIRENDERLKLYREEQLAAAARSAQAEYESALEESGKKAREYAEKIIADTDRQVRETVRRISGGNS